MQSGTAPLIFNFSISFILSYTAGYLLSLYLAYALRVYYYRSRANPTLHISTIGSQFIFPFFSFLFLRDGYGSIEPK
jgi:hypothetical protein